MKGRKVRQEKMANSKLKNCPFCGSKAKIVEIEDGYFMVQCSNEECGCGACFGEVSKSEIAKLWNNRHSSITDNNFGTDFFLDRASAEAKLREIEGDNNA